MINISAKNRIDRALDIIVHFPGRAINKVKIHVLEPRPARFLSSSNRPTGGVTPVQHPKYFLRRRLHPQAHPGEPGLAQS